MSSNSRTPWWQNAVAYQIYPRSFLDTNGDGIGDLEGIRRRLDHLSWLGVDAIWLSPFYRSPMDDAGYDVADYCDVDPLFGDLATFDALVADAHGRGLRVIVDWVPNHTSDQHPWFVSSVTDPDGPHGDWYWWRDGSPDGPPPNNWVEALTFTPAWTFNEQRGQWYLHNFYPSQPDLNWSNPAVVEAMLDTLRFWLDRGVDGFRMDVINLIGKDPALPDDPPELTGLPHLVVNDRPETHELLRRIRSLVDSYDGDRVAIGEVILLDIASILGHLGTTDSPELHLAFNFPPMHQPWTASAWRRGIESTEHAYRDAEAWPTWVLSNHDTARHRSRYGGDERVARAAAVLLLCLRGTPFLYMGEELGLEDAVVSDDRRDDPAGRDGCRAPIPWDPSPSHGWVPPIATGTADRIAEPWLPWPPDADTRNVATAVDDPTSIVHLYRDLIALRHSVVELHSAELELLDADERAPDVVAWRRGSVAIAVNFGESPQRCPVEGELLLSSGTPAAAGSPAEIGSPGSLGPFEARIVRER